MASPDLLLTGATLATLTGAAPYGLVPQGAVALAAGRIEWAGPEAELPRPFRDREEMALGGRLVTPGLIDCHSHTVFAGSRAGEFSRAR